MSRETSRTGGVGTASAILCLIALLSLPISARAAPDQGTARCAVPAALLNLGTDLPRTRERLRRGEPLTIVALGSSSTAGTGATSRERTYPSQLARALQRLYPKSPIAVINAGRGGEQVADMLKRLEPDVLARRPDLVIWQVGTNAVLRGTAPARIDRGVVEGLARLRKSGADIVLMDPQYAPKVLAHPDHAEILDEVDREARRHGDGLYQRFRIMRYWLDSGRFTLGSMLSPDRLHMNDASYRCTGLLLARAISAAVGGPPR